MKRKWQAAFKHLSQDEGFTLVMILGMGLAMLIVATTLIVRASRHEAIASTRTQSEDSLAVAEAGIARTLAQMTKPENAALLNRNYDPINPTTNKNYLGADGIPNTNDQTSTAVDEWTTYSPASVPCSTTTTSPNISYDGTVGTDGQYILRAYRYNSTAQIGTFLVEGKRKNSVSYLAIAVSVISNSAPFPGILAKNTIQLADREVLGINGNVYYNSSFSPTPGLSNVVGRTIDCSLNPTLSDAFPPTQTAEPSPGSFNTTIFGHPGRISYYKFHKLELDNETLTVDTKDGPVYIYVADGFKLDNAAKIVHINSNPIATLPKIGDLQIILQKKTSRINTNSCVDGAFIYAPDLEINFTGSGCGSFKVRGVVWAKNVTSDNSICTGCGIVTPDILDRFTNINASINLPNTYHIGNIKNWQRYQL